MKKIVYLINSLGNSGGMERVLSTKANWFASQKEYDVTVITQQPVKNNTFFELIKSVKVECLNLESPKSKISEIILGNYKKEYKRRLTKKLFELRPDITISMFGREYDFLYKINDGSKKLIEFHFSKNYLHHLINSIPNLSFRALRLGHVEYMQYKQRKAVKKYDGLILLTEKDRKLWNNKSNTYVIPNPVSFTTEDTSTVQKKQIVAIGRLIAQKGFDRLVKAYSQIAHNFPDWKLIIVGEGQDKDYLKKLVNKFNLTDKIIFKAPSKDIKNILLNSSILAMTSRYEGFGLVLTEAMECGVPCVAFDCECGPSEIIQNAEDGFLVEDGNIHEFANKLKLLMENPLLRQNFGMKAKQNVKRFYVNPIMSKWSQLFNEVNSSKTIKSNE
ncbi:MAG: glycosyltransferase family 4 protein [Bacteroidota bacterium]